MSTPLEQAIDQADQATDEQGAVIKEVKVDELEQLRHDLESANKRISDTYSSYQASQERISMLEKTLVERERQAHRPAILDETEGLQEAIKFVAESSDPTDEDRWISVVARAIPDANELMSDANFASAAAAARSRVGERSWKDPVNAIREIAHLKAEYLKQKAIEEDRQARNVAVARTDAMTIPGGSGKIRRDPPVDGAKQIWDMPAAEFEKMRNKVMTG